ncbi:MAG: dehydrogenase [bacterium]|nr:dehydrogenase [bacterium]
MPFMLLVVEKTEDRRRRPAAAGRLAYDRMSHFGEGLRARGLLLARDSLRTESVRVSVRAGTRRLVDGPFAETKEMIGGYFLLDCATREEAIEIAGACPAVEWAEIEVREIGPCWEGAV